MFPSILFERNELKSSFGEANFLAASFGWHCSKWCRANQPKWRTDECQKYNRRCNQGFHYCESFNEITELYSILASFYFSQCLKVYQWEGQSRRILAFHVSWRGLKWSWLVEFIEMNAVFRNQLQTFIGGRVNQNQSRIIKADKVIKLFTIRQSN